jgi:DNA-directed RNA polymerase specialized sigma24 family protein
MAKAMNCSRGTIMSRLFHARNNLQKLLVARLDLDADKIDGEATSPDVSSPEVATT